MEPAAERNASDLADRGVDLEALLLAHPLRARIAAELAKQSLEPEQLARVLNEDLPRVRYHWRVLREAGSELPGSI